MVSSTLSDWAKNGYGWYNNNNEVTPKVSHTTNAASSSANQANSETSRDSRLPEALQLPEFGEDSSANNSSGNKYWNYTQDAAGQTYSAVSGYMSSISLFSGGDDGVPMEDIPSTPLHSNSAGNPSILTSPTLLNMFQNPYVRVRGTRGADKPSSMEAVRNLLSVTAPDMNNGNNIYISDVNDEDYGSGDSVESATQEANGNFVETPKYSIRSSGTLLNTTLNQILFSSPTANQQQRLLNQENDPTNPYTNNTNNNPNSPSETASHLAEGTLRAFRDIALDEAVELHSALRYWSYRWERPILSWLEAGPTVWFSKDGYRHQVIGQKVSQIQAVLARRCASIGDLQQHLLRAGWQRGVAQWGVLGDGGEWAAVAGFDGRMPSNASMDIDADTTDHHQASIDPSTGATPLRRNRMPRVSSELSDMPLPPSVVEGHDLPRRAPISKVSQLPQERREGSLYYTNVFVQHKSGGEIVLDNPALAEWSVDAMSIVRRHLYRAANGRINLPLTENWAQGDDQSLSYGSLNNFHDDSTAATNESHLHQKLPLWASLAPHNIMAPVDEHPNLERTESEDEQEDHQDLSSLRQNRVTVSDLPLMVKEVSELLDVMEGVMEIQRARRLEKLKQPSKLRRSWYVSAMIVPTVTYFMYKTRNKQYGWMFLKYTGQKLVEFFKEHVILPFLAMYDEFTKGTENISDHQARDIVVENLQKMIRSWLDENYPEMPAAERARRANAMDVSLVENQKEASMQNLFELNSVIRMSFIEAQFIKKEMMNALLALDEMRASTNFNMNLAAVTPVVLLMYLTKRAFQFVFYATLKLGKSREETYGSFLHILTEIERLLNIRDNPPNLSFHNGEEILRMPTMDTASQHNTGNSSGDSVLGTDDIGMLMLHIHALRTILWRDRRRFSSAVIRSVAEDLAELAGERGAVSVRQQLQIIGRMFRTYPFLQIISSELMGYDDRQ